MSSKVLIIDDEKDISLLISEILNDENYITESAINSSEAIKKYISFKPDLIILDVWLGKSELDGIELLQEFKKLNPSLPIIIISGHGTVDMAVKAIKNGAYDFLEKPFNSDKILILSKSTFFALLKSLYFFKHSSRYIDISSELFLFKIKKSFFIKLTVNTFLLVFLNSNIV